MTDTHKTDDAEADYIRRHTWVVPLRTFHPNETWFKDSDQLPGWTIEWQLALDSSRTMVISALRITPTHPEPKRPGAPGIPRMPIGGVTTAMLRRIRLGTPARSGRYALMTDEWTPEPQRWKSGRSRGKPETITWAWWRRLSARYNALRRENRQDYAKVLAEEFGLSRGVMRTRISRGIEKGYIKGEYIPPPSATRVQREPK